VLETRRSKPFWGRRRLALQLARKGVTPTPSASTIYRALLLVGAITTGSPAMAKGGLKRWCPAPLNLVPFSMS
jgi:hypothetical protein